MATYLTATLVDRTPKVVMGGNAGRAFYKPKANGEIDNIVHMAKTGEVFFYPYPLFDRERIEISETEEGEQASVDIGIPAGKRYLWNCRTYSDPITGDIIGHSHLDDPAPKIMLGYSCDFFLPLWLPEFRTWRLEVGGLESKSGLQNERFLASINREINQPHLRINHDDAHEIISLSKELEGLPYTHQVKAIAEWSDGPDSKSVWNFNLRQSREVPTLIGECSEVDTSNCTYIRAKEMNGVMLNGRMYFDATMNLTSSGTPGSDGFRIIQGVYVVGVAVITALAPEGIAAELAILAACGQVGLESAKPMFPTTERELDKGDFNDAVARGRVTGFIPTFTDNDDPRDSALWSPGHYPRIRTFYWRTHLWDESGFVRQEVWTQERLVPLTKSIGRWASWYHFETPDSGE